MEIYVRRAERSDIPQILPLLDLLDALHLEWYPDRFKPPGGGGRGANELVLSLVDSSQEYWVAVLEGKVLGVVLLMHRKTDPNPVVKAEDFLLLDMLIVDPEHRGKGIAKLLMEQGKQVAKEAKYPRIKVKVYEKNQGAMKLYEALGYTTTVRVLEMSLADQ